MLSGVMPWAVVVSELLFAAAVGFTQCALHRAGDLVGVNRITLTSEIARGAAEGRIKRGIDAQETVLVGVQKIAPARIGNVETFEQQDDADQRVERPEPQNRR